MMTNKNEKQLARFQQVIYLLKIIYQFGGTFVLVSVKNIGVLLCNASLADCRVIDPNWIGWLIYLIRDTGWFGYGLILTTIPAPVSILVGGIQYFGRAVTGRLTTTKQGKEYFRVEKE